MPVLARLDGVVLSAAAQTLLSLSLGGGVWVDRVTVKNLSGNPVTNLRPLSRPYEGGPQTLIGDLVASLASGQVSAIDIMRFVEHFDLEGSQGSGGNAVDVVVTGGVASP